MYTKNEFAPVLEFTTELKRKPNALETTMKAPCIQKRFHRINLFYLVISLKYANYFIM